MGKLAATLFAVGFWSLVACGGGIEPIAPYPEGNGMPDTTMGGTTAGPSDGGGTIGTAQGRAAFIEHFAPVMTEAGCVPCHGGSVPPLFLVGGTPDAMYNALASPPNNYHLQPTATNRMLQKPAHQGAPALNDAQKAKGAMWLAAEGL